MKAAEKQLLETLEPRGIALTIRAALGRAEMVRLANASRVAVPGMRNRSVSLMHLSEALADKFVAEGPCRRLIFKSLQGAARSVLPAYRKLSLEDVRQRLSDGERVRADAEIGKLLFLLVVEPKDGLGAEEIRAVVADAFLGMSEAEARPGEHSAVDGEIPALRREKSELSRRAADLVALVDRLRDRDRQFREEIAQRKFDINNLKLQLAKVKKERDSLEKELRQLSARVEEAEKKPLTIRQLSEQVAATHGETRRLAGVIEKLQARLAKEDRATGADGPSIAVTLECVKREILALKKERAGDRDRILKALEEAKARTPAPAQEAAGPTGSSRAGGSTADGQRRGSGLDRVAVFVDVQNMFYAARGQNARLDFDVLLQTATRGRRLIRAVAYVVEAREVDQSGFIALLQQKRYEVKRKDLKVRSDGSFKGDWDMEIALDALEMADKVDLIVLVTGDGDFTGLVQKIKIRGPRVEVYSFPQNTAKELREAADKFFPIDKRMLIKAPRSTPRQEPTGTAGS